MELRILNVTAQRDAVDKLIWKTELRLDGWGTDKLFLLASWSGDVVLYRVPNATGSIFGEQEQRMRLSSRWLRWRDRDSIRGWATTTKNIVLETELPQGALERIEAFRSDGTLFARLEGTLFVITVLDKDWSPPERPDLDAMAIKAELRILPAVRLMADNLWQSLGLWNRLADPQRILGVDFATESFELSRERWESQICTVLRPERQVISQDSGVAQKAIPPAAETRESSVAQPRELVAAHEALRTGKFDECIALCITLVQGIHEELQSKKEELRSKKGLLSDIYPWHPLRLHANSLLNFRYAADQIRPTLPPALAEHVARHVLTCTESLYRLYREWPEHDSK